MFRRALLLVLVFSGACATPKSTAKATASSVGRVRIVVRNETSRKLLVFEKRDAGDYQTIRGFGFVPPHQTVAFDLDARLKRMLIGAEAAFGQGVSKTYTDREILELHDYGQGTSNQVSLTFGDQP